ncbi:MAG: hypothetical protein JOZ71_15535 [Ktedonobacteraceae bacterium]|nr:hypothetical protein [Ktedonobacteraceae bacterium]
MDKTAHWWDDLGTFPTADEQARFPKPGSVIHAYLLRRRVAVSQLAAELQLTERMLRMTMYKDAGLDSMTRRRYFMYRLGIPAVLLGLDGQHPQTSQQPPWWEQEGYSPFEAGPDGYPRPGQVIRWYRERKMKTLADGRHKPWTQADLAQACDPPISEESVNRMERQNKGLDSMKRREALSFMLSIPPALLGLDGLSHEVGMPLSLPAIHLPTLKVDTALLQTYRSKQTRLFTGYYTHDGQEALSEVSWWISHLHEEVLPVASGANLLEALAIESLYHDFIMNVAHQQRDDETALSHVNASLSLAQGAGNEEAIAVALLRRASALQGQSLISEAKQDIDGALLHLKRAANPSLIVVGAVRTRAGLIHAQAAQTETEMTIAFGLLDQAERVAQVKELGEDTYFLKFDRGNYHLIRATALMVKKSPVGLRDALDEAERFIPPDLTRRHLSIAIVRAQGLLKQATQSSSPLGKEQCYYEATVLATEALDVAQQIKSRLNRDRIEQLYEQIKASTFGEDPAVVRLGWKLSRW